MPAGPTFENSSPEHFLVEPAHHRCVDDRAIPLAPHRPVAEENVKDCIVTAAMDRDGALGAGLHQHPNDPVDGWHASACRFHPRALRLVSLHRRHRPPVCRYGRRPTFSIFLRARGLAQAERQVVNRRPAYYRGRIHGC